MLRAGLLRSFSLMFALAAALELGGCSSANGPLPPVDRNAASATAAASGSYVVQRGDTIYGIARRFNIPVRALIDANSLQPPFQVTPGQVLQLSTTADYTVVRGDTLLGVSHKTKVSFTTLARINNLSPPYVLKVGQRLALPGANATRAAAGSTDGVTVIQSPQAAPSMQAAPPAQSAQSTQSQPVPVPPPPPSNAQASVRDSQPSARAGGYVSLADRQQQAQPAIAQAAPTPGPQAPVADGQPAADQPAKAQTASLATPLPPPPPKSGRGYVWPVKGNVVAEYGPSGKGQHNDGINIEVPRGTPVVAAEDGVVAYSGNELRGFGNLLLIKHADGWVTAYAHNDQLLVKRGDVVKRGQKIALSGDSGGVSSPQLHFEVRRGTRAVDPMTVLGKKTTPTVSPDDQTDPG